MTGDRDTAWRLVLYDTAQRETCWCSGDRGHMGWLVCAQAEVDRLMVIHADAARP